MSKYINSVEFYGKKFNRNSVKPLSELFGHHKKFNLIDEEDVVQFYNDLDAQLELSVDVLDDFVTEAKKVYKFNPWLTHALPLHRCREMGYYSRLFDVLDQRPLTKGELKEFCALEFGENHLDAMPDPDVNWNGFKVSIKGLVNVESNQWNPKWKIMSPWIDIPILQLKYEGIPCSCSIM